MAALCAARGIPHDDPALGGLGRPRQPAGPGARRRGGALIADWARGARHRRGGARPHAGRPGGDLPDAPRPRLGRGRAERHGAGRPRPRACSGCGRCSGCGGRRCGAGWRPRAWPGRRTRATPTRASTASGRGRRCRPLAALGLGPERLAATAGPWRAPARRWRRRRRSWRAACLAAGGGGRPGARPGAVRARRRRSCGCGCWPAALCWVSGALYRPRLARLEAALAAVEAGGVGHGLTLHGCVLRAARRPGRHPPRAGAGGAAGAAGARGAGTGAGRSRASRRRARA